MSFIPCRPPHSISCEVPLLRTMLSSMLDSICNALSPRYSIAKACPNTVLIEIDLECMLFTCVVRSLSRALLTLALWDGLMCGLHVICEGGGAFSLRTHVFVSVTFCLCAPESQPTTLQNDNFRCSELENLLFITRDTITLCECESSHTGCMGAVFFVSTVFPARCEHFAIKLRHLRNRHT